LKYPKEVLRCKDCNQKSGPDHGIVPKYWIPKEFNYF
jgi:hypothetical protein